MKGAFPGDPEQIAEGGKPHWHFHCMKPTAAVTHSPGLAGKGINLYW